jgi:hypothetical protein
MKFWIWPIRINSNRERRIFRKYTLNPSDFYSISPGKSKVPEDLLTHPEVIAERSIHRGWDHEAARMSLEVPPAAGT